MNILIPHKWLLEQVTTEATPEEIAEQISLCGPSVEHIYDREGDSVYDIEVTTNRVDSMSVRGIARETAVIMTQFGKKSELQPLKLEKPKQDTKESMPLPKITDKQGLSNRIMCVVLKDVQRAPTPDWMAERLKQTEMNVHDAVIDITNYITHELGHPCHAFDYDKIMELGGEIIVTEAEAGEPFTTLDGESYQTVGGEIVYKNPAGEIIDLPAIKGTANSAIDDDTKNVLFWIESLDAKKVRFASMTHAIRTVAAQLNEKHVDPHLGEDVLLRGIELYREICDAQVASEIYDHFTDKEPVQPVEVSLDTFVRYLGVELEKKRIRTILEDLGCTVTDKKDSIVVLPPTFRRDITIPADVVEEVARIYGYHNLPNKLMDTPIPTSKPADTNYVVENRIKRFLAAVGWQELYTYSMVSEEIALQSGYTAEEHLKLQNPLTDDREYLRRSLLPSLEEVIDTNSREGELSLFELALEYHPREKELPEQDLYLALVSNEGYAQTKGTLESLLRTFFVTADFSESDTPNPVFAQAAQIEVKGSVIGEVGVLKSGKSGVRIHMPSFLSVARTYPIYQPIPTTGSIIEDLTFTLPEKTLVGTVVATIEDTDEQVVSVQQKGEPYQQNYTFTVTYHHPERNLSSEEVTPLRKKIVDAVARSHTGELVGSLE